MMMTLLAQNKCVPFGVKYNTFAWFLLKGTVLIKDHYFFYFCIFNESNYTHSDI